MYEKNLPCGAHTAVRGLLHGGTALFRRLQQGSARGFPAPAPHVRRGGGQRRQRQIGQPCGRHGAVCVQRSRVPGGTAGSAVARNGRRGRLLALGRILQLRALSLRGRARFWQFAYRIRLGGAPCVRVGRSQRRGKRHGKFDCDRQPVQRGGQPGLSARLPAPRRVEFSGGHRRPLPAAVGRRTSVGQI